jgi:hypothetical protein
MIIQPCSKAARRALAATMMCVIFAGCGGNGAKSGAQNYLDGLKLFNYPGCYQMLSHQDQVDRTLDQFLGNIPMAPDVNKDWFKPIELKIEYTVGTPKVDGDRATVPVTVTMPDLVLWERTANALATPKEPTEAIAQKNISENSFPKMTFEDSMVMVKEGDDWKVLFNYAKKDQLNKAHKQALDLYHKHDYDKAIAAFQDVMSQLDKDPSTDDEGLKFRWGRELKDLQTIKAQIPEAQAYTPKLTLKDVDMKMTASRVPGIFGEITNTGDKALDEVQMTVNYYFGKGKARKVLYTEEHSPVATPLEFTNFGRPILPLVPTEVREFGFKLTAPPDIQQKATPDLIISNVTFTQSSAPLPKPPPPPTPGPFPTPAGAKAMPPKMPKAGAAAPQAMPNPAPPPQMPMPGGASGTNPAPPPPPPPMPKS